MVPPRLRLPNEAEQQGNRDAKPKGSQYEPFPNVEANGSHHQEGNREEEAGKL